VANLYTDRFGRLVFHGRLAKFDPATISAGAGDQQWDWHHWHVGDGDAVAASPSTVAQLRTFAFNRGLSKIINSASRPRSGSPTRTSPGRSSPTPPRSGHSGSAPGRREPDHEDGAAERQQRARRDEPLRDVHGRELQAAREPRHRPQRPLDSHHSRGRRDHVEADVRGRHLRPSRRRVTSPGGGLFVDSFLSRGIHEENKPLNRDYDDVDLSPGEIFIGKGSGTGYTLDS
jgi:hypothetical protein